VKVFRSPKSEVRNPKGKRQPTAHDFPLIGKWQIRTLLLLLAS